MASDPLTDERALELQAALTDEIDGLGQHFTLMSITGREVAQALRVADASDWTGPAADTFRSRLGKLPAVLDGLSEMFWRAGNALDTYGMDVSLQQPRFARLAGELVPARSRAHTATARYLLAQLTLQGAGGDDPVTRFPGAAGSGNLAKAQGDYNVALAAFTKASTEVDHLETQCFAVLDAFGHSCATAISRLTEAIERCPIQNEQVLPTPAAGRFINSLFTSIGDAFLNLGPDAKAYAENPTSLSKLAKVSEDLGTVVGTVGLGLSILALPEDGPGAAALAALIRGADTTVDATIGVSTTYDAGRLVEGDDDLGAVLADGATIVLDGGGKIVLHDPDAAVDAIRGQYRSVSALKKALGDEPLTAENIDTALHRLPYKLQAPLRTNPDLDLSDPRAVDAYLNLVSGSYLTAAKEARELHAINSGIQVGGSELAGVSGRTADGGEDR